MQWSCTKDRICYTENDRGYFATNDEHVAEFYLPSNTKGFHACIVGKFMLIPNENQIILMPILIDNRHQFLKKIYGSSGSRIESDNKHNVISIRSIDEESSHETFVIDSSIGELLVINDKGVTE